MSGVAATGIPAAVRAVLPGTLALIGRALEARLEAAFPLNLFQHGFVPAKLDGKEWMKLSTRTPFVGLGWNDVANSTGMGRLFSGESGWSVFLTTKNNNSIGARYFGDSQGQQWAPGLFAMVQVAVAVLNGLTIPGLGTVIVVKASNAYGEGWDENMAMCVIDVAVDTTIALPDAVTAPGDLGLFQTLATVWNFVVEDGASAVGDAGGVDELDDVIVVPTVLQGVDW